MRLNIPSMKNENMRPKLHPFNPKWYFHSSLSLDNQQITQKMFENFISDDENFHQPKTWNCDVQSSWAKKSDLNGPWDDWMSVIDSVWSEFIDTMGTQRSIEILLQDAWVNKYNPGDSQEMHDHCGAECNLSMVYFHTINDDDGCQFQFCNTDFGVYSMQGLSDTLKLPTSNLTIPKVSQGDILIFPSHYYHLVSPHRGTKTRITFSLNFKIIPILLSDVTQSQRKN